MQRMIFSKDEIMNRPEAAQGFLEYLDKNSFGFIPHDWKSMTNDEITNIALDSFFAIEREINVLDFMKRSTFATH